MNCIANGNITQKSDVGLVYDYEATGKPYQLTSVITSTGLVPDVEQTVSYTSFEQPSTITETPYQALFTYNADSERAKMEVKQSGATIKTRWYSGSRYIKETAASVTKEFTWIGGDAYTAPCLAITQSGATTYYYLLRDHLGTITHVTDASGNVVNEYNFDAWGRRRNFTDWSYSVAAQTDILPDRGFTGHEYLPWFKLYNMNGRLYDPVVGRFLEPDPVVQDAFSTQNLNRYSYALNNPLKYVDPSGWVMNPGFNCNVWSMIENAWNNTQSNYDMIYTYDNGRMTGTSSLTYSGEGNTYWYFATVGEWYRDSNGNPTEKNGNSASFLKEFYSVTFPNIAWITAQKKGDDWFNTAINHLGYTVGGSSLINDGVKTIAKEYVRQVAINNELAGIKNAKLPNTYNAAKSLSKKLGVVGGVIVAVDVAYNSQINTSDLISATMTGIAFTGWGAPIAGLWFIADFGTGLVTGTSLSNRIDSSVGVPLLDWDY